MQNIDSLSESNLEKIGDELSEILDSDIKARLEDGAIVFDLVRPFDFEAAELKLNGNADVAVSSDTTQDGTDSSPEVQVLSRNGNEGSFSLLFSGRQSRMLNYDASADDVLQALLGMLDVDGNPLFGEPELAVEKLAGPNQSWQITVSRSDGQGDIDQITLSPRLAFHINLDNLLNIAIDAIDASDASDKDTLKQAIIELLQGTENLLDVDASGQIDLQAVGELNLSVGFDPNATVGTAIFVTDDSRLDFDLLLDARGPAV